MLVQVRWEAPPALLEEEQPAVDEPIPFWPADLPVLDMSAGGWSKREMRTAIIAARRHLLLGDTLAA